MLQLRTAQTDGRQHAGRPGRRRSQSQGPRSADHQARPNKTKSSSNKPTPTRPPPTESIATLNDKLADREKRIVQFSEALEKWKTGYQKAAEVARTKEDERAKLASEAIVLKRTIADREAKNIALFNTSNEILDRFENYALGKALSAREPFIGTTRVKVENLVQGYKDKILDNRISAATPKP